MTATIVALLSEHHWGDLIYWFLFFLGQCLWVLICAAAAVRSQHNAIKSRRAYVKANWDIFLIRFAVEWIVIFYFWRHYSVNDLLAHFNISWQFPMNTGNSPVAAIALGIGSDTILNAVAKWQKAPDWFKPVQAFIQERIPQVPLEQVAIVKTTTEVIPADDATPITTKVTTAKVMAPKADDSSADTKKGS